MKCGMGGGYDHNKRICKEPTDHLKKLYMDWPNADTMLTLCIFLEVLQDKHPSLIELSFANSISVILP